MNKELILLQLSKFEHRLEQWARTQTIALNGAETYKLQDIHTQIFGQSFKGTCKACISEALTRLWNWYNQTLQENMRAAVDSIPKLDLPSAPEEQPKKRRTRKKK